MVDVTCFLFEFHISSYFSLLNANHSCSVRVLVCVRMSQWEQGGVPQKYALYVTHTQRIASY